MFCWFQVRFVYPKQSIIYINTYKYHINFCKLISLICKLLNMLATIVLLLIVVPLLVLYYLITKDYDYFKSRGVPYEKPFFIFGSFYKLFMRQQHILDYLREVYTNHKSQPYAGLYFLNKPTLLVRDPELIRTILIKDFDKFINRPFANNENVDPIASNTLFSAQDLAWKSLRQKISPVFTSGKMKLMMPLMQNVSEHLEKYIESHCQEEIDTRELTKRYAVDVIASCAFGINSNCINKVENNEVYDQALRLLDLKTFKRSFSVFCFFFVPKFVEWFRLTFADPVATKYFMNVFNSAYNERKKLNIVRNDLIDLLHSLKDGEKAGQVDNFDDIKMASQAISFFSAGNDTTSLTITFSLYELAKNPEIQKKVKKDIKDTIEKFGGISYEAIQNMKYLDMVVNESLRLYPFAPFLNRETSTDYTFEKTGLTLTKKTSIIIPIPGLHSDPAYFPNPEKYDPERFSDENKANIVPYTYLPFGDGPRNCIGQRFGLLGTKMALATILNKFSVEPCASTPIPMEYNVGSLFVVPKDKIVLKFIKD